MPERTEISDNICRDAGRDRMSTDEVLVELLFAKMKAKCRQSTRDGTFVKLKL